MGLMKKLKKASGFSDPRKTFRRATMGFGDPITGKLNEMVAKKTGIGINPDTGKFSFESMLDPGGLAGGKGDLFHKKLKGYKEFTPETAGPDQARIDAENTANQQAAQMLAERRRLLRRNSLSTGGGGRSASLSSVLAYGKTQLGQ